MSNFQFLQPEWKQIHEAAEKAEASAIPDPRAVLILQEWGFLRSSCDRPIIFKNFNIPYQKHI